MGTGLVVHYFANKLSLHGLDSVSIQAGAKPLPNAIFHEKILERLVP
jgi:hypothetical protein